MWVKKIQLVCVWAAVGMYFKAGDPSVRNVWCHGRQKTKVMVGFVPTEDCDGEWFHVSYTRVALGSPWIERTGTGLVTHNFFPFVSMFTFLPYIPTYTGPHRLESTRLVSF